MEKQLKKLKTERFAAEVRGQQMALTLDNLNHSNSHYHHTSAVVGTEGDNPAYNTSPMLKSFIASLPLPEGMCGGKLSPKMLIMSA